MSTAPQTHTLDALTWPTVVCHLLAQLTCTHMWRRDVSGDAKNLEKKIALEGAAVDALGLRHNAARDTKASQLQDKIAREEEELVAMRRHPRISRGRAHQKARRVMKTQAISAGGDQDLLGPVQWPGVDYADHASETSKLQPLPQQPAASPLAGTPLDLSDSKQAVTYCTQRVCNNMFVFGNVNLGTGETYETRPEVLGALGPEWDYAGLSTGPGNWSDLEPQWGVCKRGRQQSPINIELSIRPDRYLKMLRWSGPSNPYEATLVGPVYANTFTLTNLKGHVTVSGLKMELANMTIHTPSEHKVAGKHHHGELQFWHKAEVGDDHVTMIISAFLVLADATAPFLKTTVETARGFAYTYNADALNGQGYDNPIYRGDVKPSLWFSTSELAEGVLGWGANYANYVTYAGSLSQPPCTEGVTRIVVRKPVPIKAGDLAAIAALQGQTNRPTQALNGRGVYEAMSHPPGQ
jgi:carbonic anhydrase